MKPVLTAFAMISLFAPGMTGAVASQAPQPGNSIQLIRQQYAAINKRAGGYRKVKKELSGFSLEGGEMIAYFNGPAIVKIVANHYGESGKAYEEYYYAAGS